MKMQIVRAKAEDADALTEIAHAAKRHWGYSEQWIKAWRDILTMRPEFITFNVTYCATEGSRAVGFYVLTTESDGIHLDHLWIRPSAMGRGIGRTLFQHAVGQAGDLGFQAIKIEADPNAEGFYRQMGAKRVGENVMEIEGKPRELPLLIYEIKTGAESRAISL
jgi:ribosomal protein S18 acetylase RimI-like enzyme